MTWDDIEDVLFDGTKEEISNIKCPECGGKIEYSYNHITNSLTIRCRSCGFLSRSNSCNAIPNCAK